MPCRGGRTDRTWLLVVVAPLLLVLALRPAPASRSPAIVRASSLIGELDRLEAELQVAQGRLAHAQALHERHRDWLLRELTLAGAVRPETLLRRQAGLRREVETARAREPMPASPRTVEPEPL